MDNEAASRRLYLDTRRLLTRLAFTPVIFRPCSRICGLGDVQANFHGFRHTNGQGKQMPKLYSEADVRRLIPIGHSKYYELIGSGALRSVRIGRRRLVPASAVDEYIASLDDPVNAGGPGDEAA